MNCMAVNATRGEHQLVFPLGHRIERSLFSGLDVHAQRGVVRARLELYESISAIRLDPDPFQLDFEPPFSLAIPPLDTP